MIRLLVSDSKELEEPKDPDTCHIFAIYKLLASEAEIEVMKTNYIAGGYGYGHAKIALYDLILTKFKSERELYNSLMADTTKIDKALALGATKAKKVARKVLDRVREKIGFN